MDEKKLHTREFQLKGSGRNMRCKSLQKRFTGKTTECSKHLRHNAIKKNILSELNRCIFQISLKYIKLVIPKILFILVLCSFNFYFKTTWPLPPNKIPPPPHTKIKIFYPPAAKTFPKFLTPPPQSGEGKIKSICFKASNYTCYQPSQNCWYYCYTADIPLQTNDDYKDGDKVWFVLTTLCSESANNFPSRAA